MWETLGNSNYSAVVFHVFQDKIVVQSFSAHDHNVARMVGTSNQKCP